MEASRWAEGGGGGGSCKERRELEGRARQLAEALADCSRGLESLQATYATDASTVAHLEVLGKGFAVLGARAEGLVRALTAQDRLFGD